MVILSLLFFIDFTPWKKGRRQIEQARKQTRKVRNERGNPSNMEGDKAARKEERGLQKTKQDKISKAESQETIQGTRAGNAALYRQGGKQAGAGGGRAASARREGRFPARRLPS